MVKDHQVRRLFMVSNQFQYQYQAADAAGMGVKTARKYLRSKKLPSQLQVAHDWKTHPDEFEQDWPWVQEQLRENPTLEAKTLFAALLRMVPGRYREGQLRTLQRRVQVWRATQGPLREVFFEQRYKPGDVAGSDFTHMRSLGITIGGQPFDHLLYHFVLCYSNWETFTICFSESFESISLGLQNALWELGGVPRGHRTDNLRAAVNPVGHPEVYTQPYQALARHYGLESMKTQPGHPNENGDVEQRHYRLKRAVEQALLLRGNRDFGSRSEYEAFLREVVDPLNAGRQDKFQEERAQFHSLPSYRYEDHQSLKVTVSRSSTVRIKHNTYSVYSRLIGEGVEIRVYADLLEVWYAHRKVDTLPRLRGENGHRIQYRHIIDWLIRKPGAFEQYRYKDDLFPTSLFRVVYDLLRRQYGIRQANKQYLRILELAARENECRVNEALRLILDQDQPIGFETIEATVLSGRHRLSAIPEVRVEPVQVGWYDRLLDHPLGGTV